MADIQRKRKMNLSFYAEIRKNELVSNRFVRELEKKKNTSIFQKKLIVEWGLYIKGALFSDMLIYFRIKLIVKFIWRCLRKK